MGRKVLITAGVVVATVGSAIWLRERVEPTITLRDSNFDPVADLPVRRVVSCEYSESNTTQRGVIHGTVPQEWVLPFAHQRYDHLSVLR